MLRLSKTRWRGFVNRDKNKKGSLWLPGGILL